MAGRDSRGRSVNATVAQRFKLDIILGFSHPREV